MTYEENGVEIDFSKLSPQLKGDLIYYLDYLQTKGRLTQEQHDNYLFESGLADPDTKMVERQVQQERTETWNSLEQ